MKRYASEHDSSHLTWASDPGPLTPTPAGRDVLWALVCGLGFMIIGAIVGAFVGLGLFGLAGLWLPVALSGILGSAGLYWVLVHRRGWGLVEFGFRRGVHSLAHLIWPAPILLLLTATATAVVGTSVGLSPAQSDSASTAISAQPGWMTVLAVVLFATLVVPLIEEIVFRRVLLDWLMATMPTAVAALTVIVVFALIHIAPPVMLYMLFFGAALVALRLWYQTLWAPLIYHVLNNAFVAAIAAPAIMA